MSTHTIPTEETFSLNDQVYFRKPNKLFRRHMETYVKAFGKGPFVAIGISKAQGVSKVHSQMIKIGRENQEPIMVSFGKKTPEPAEVSGFWLTHEAW